MNELMHRGEGAIVSGDGVYRAYWSIYSLALSLARSILALISDDDMALRRRSCCLAYLMGVGFRFVLHQR
jgi:hypothetical protein